MDGVICWATGAYMLDFVKLILIVQLTGTIADVISKKCQIINFIDHYSIRHLIVTKRLLLMSWI